MAAEVKKILIGALGLLGLGAVALLTRSYYLRGRKNQAEKDAATEGHPATYAKLLYMAFENDNSFGWGTDEDLVFRVIRVIPSMDMYEKVIREYRDLTKGRSLNADLSSELSSGDYSRVVAMLSQKEKKSKQRK